MLAKAQSAAWLQPRCCQITHVSIVLYGSTLHAASAEHGAHSWHAFEITGVKGQTLLAHVACTLGALPGTCYPACAPCACRSMPSHRGESHSSTSLASELSTVTRSQAGHKHKGSATAFEPVCKTAHAGNLDMLGSC
jgi:hypothetical protein